MIKSARVAGTVTLGAALTFGGVGIGIGLAPPASAGCQGTLIPGESYCDKPPGPNGVYERCHQAPSYPVFGGRGVIEDVTPPPECYPVDPSQPIPWVSRRTTSTTDAGAAPSGIRRRYRRCPGLAIVRRPGRLAGCCTARPSRPPCSSRTATNPVCRVPQAHRTFGPRRGVTRRGLTGS